MKKKKQFKAEIYWDYMVILSKPGHLQRELCQWGEGGWELKSAHRQPDEGYTLIFGRNLVRGSLLLRS